jgi:hypothetical protein
LSFSSRLWRVRAKCSIPSIFSIRFDRKQITLGREAEEEDEEKEERERRVSVLRAMDTLRAVKYILEYPGTSFVQYIPYNTTVPQYIRVNTY